MTQTKRIQRRRTRLQPKKSNSPDTFAGSIKSGTCDGLRYELEYVPALGAVSCTCPGFRRWRHCYHTDRLRDLARRKGVETSTLACCHVCGVVPEKGRLYLLADDLGEALPGAICDGCVAARKAGG